MFKAGKSVSINGKTVKNEGGVLVAPKINFQGIVLRASTEIPKEVIDFFVSKGAKIEQISEDGDKLVRLTGNFNITKKEVLIFLDKYKDLKIQIETPLVGKAIKSKPALDFLKTKIFQNSGGTITSPTMNIMGIELNADEEISKEVKDFLTSKGVVIKLIEKKGQKFIELSGTFTLKIEEVQAFLKQQEDLKKAAEDKKENEEANSYLEAEAINFQKQVRARMKAIYQNNQNKMDEIVFGYNFILEKDVIAQDQNGNMVPAIKQIPLLTKLPTTIHATESFSFSAPKDSISMGCSKAIAHEDLIFVSGKNNEIVSKPEPQINMGILGELTSGVDTSFKSKQKTAIKNSVVLAGKNIILDAAESDINFGFENNVSWVNPPLIHSFVYANEKDSDDLTANVDKPSQPSSNATSNASGNNNAQPNPEQQFNEFVAGQAKELANLKI